MSDIVDRLRAEEKRMRALHDLVLTYRSRNEGGALSDLNNLHHAIGGRDPILESAANEIVRLRTAIHEAHTALDRHLGDTDLTHFETDDEMLDEAPDQWAAMRLARTF